MRGQRAYRVQDYATAIREWTPLANEGNARAQFRLAEMFAEGRGVEKDLKTAADWYCEAAEHGYVRAQVKLGELYEAGRGYSEARKWYLKAAEQGVARAQYTLARMYWYGRGVNKNDAEAAKWYRKSAEPKLCQGPILARLSVQARTGRTEKQQGSGALVPQGGEPRQRGGAVPAR